MYQIVGKRSSWISSWDSDLAEVSTRHSSAPAAMPVSVLTVQAAMRAREPVCIFEAGDSVAAGCEPPALLLGATVEAERGRNELSQNSNSRLQARPASRGEASWGADRATEARTGAI